MTLSTHGGGRQRELRLTYPNVVAEPGEVLLRAVVVTDLLIAAPCRKKEEKKPGREYKLEHTKSERCIKFN